MSSHPGRTSTLSTKAKAKAKQRVKRAAAGRTTPGGTAEPTRAEEDAEPPDGGNAAAPTQTADRDDLHDEVDWGSADPASATPDKDTESAKSESPEGGKRPEEHLAEPEPRPDSSSSTRVPVVLQPEPGPDGSSNTRVPVVLRPNLGAQRPRTPSRSPRRRPARQPEARAVQQVQDHMRASRLRRSQMHTP